MTTWTPVGQRIHAVTIEAPNAPSSDGDGSFTQTWTPLVADELVAIVPASARDLERKVLGTVAATATHLVTMRYRSDLTRTCRLVYGSRTFSIVGLQNVDEKNREWLIACTEDL